MQACTEKVHIFNGDQIECACGTTTRITPRRNVVYLAIEGERAYQDRKWPDNLHSTLEYLVYMEDYIAEAKRVLSRRPDPEAKEFALHTVRKVAAMAVAAMEQNGVKTRDVEGARPVGYVEA
jgi:hypothetical protein